jgi:membrane fusion protein, multidrug efflux system
MHALANAPIVLSITVLCFFSSCQSKKNEAGDQKGLKKAMTVNGIVVHPAVMENKILSTGSILANEEIEIRSETQGRITKINFEEGGLVTGGEILVKIDDSDLQAQLKKLRLQEKEQKDDVYRKEKLLELKAISQEEYDKSINQLGIIQADIELLQANIEHTEIRAPFDGKVGLRSISPGGFISPALLIGRLQQTDPVKIDFSIPEKYRFKIRAGSLILFEVEGIDSLFRGRVYAIEPRIDPSTRNILIRAICPNPKNLLVPGSFAKVQVLLDNIPNALIIPSEAVIPQIDGEKVFVVRDGKVRSQMIVSGVRTDRNVQVERGLQDNDTVVISGILQVKDGMPVSVKIPQGK